MDATETLPPFATVQDVKDRWPGFPGGADAHASVLIEDASQLILDTVPSAKYAPESTLRRITCSMVKRAMNTPDELEGISQMSQTVGGVSTSFSPSNAGGDLYLTKAEKAALGAGSGRSRAWGFKVADLNGGPRHRPWCAIMFRANYCSCGADLTLAGPLYEEGY